MDGCKARGRVNRPPAYAYRCPIQKPRFPAKMYPSFRSKMSSIKSGSGILVPKCSRRLYKLKKSPKIAKIIQKSLQATKSALVDLECEERIFEVQRP